MTDEDRIRQKAHALWEHEGKPEGRSASHWESAREMIALEDSFGTTLKPLKETLEDPVEPAFMAENQGDVPGLTDQGEDEGGPSRAAETALADEMPLSVDKSSAVEKPAETAKPSKRGKAAARR